MKLMKLFLSLFVVLTQIFPANALADGPATLGGGGNSQQPTCTLGNCSTSGSGVSGESDDFFDNSPLSNPSVPDGWTVAASNANYAFLESVETINGLSRKTLRLLNLQSNENTLLTSVPNQTSSLIATVRDVAPDGSVVIYGTGTTSGQGSAAIKSLSTNASSVVSGRLTSVTFSENLMVVEVDSPWVIGIKDYHAYRLSDLQKTDEYSKIHSSYTNLHVIDPDAQILVASRINPSQPAELQLVIYSAADPNRLKRYAPITLGIDSNARMTYRDAIKLASGSQVVTASMEADHVNSTTVWSLVNKKGLTLDGTVINAVLSGNFASYTLRRKNGTVYTVLVNLVLPAVVSLPGGITPRTPDSITAVAGMPGVFKVEASDMYVYTVNLFTGKIIDLGSNDPAKAVRVEQVKQIYRDILNREADISGLMSWTLSGMTIVEIRSGILNGPEARPIQIRKFYVELLGREPDSGGFNNWMNSGLSVSQIKMQILYSPEYLNAGSNVVFFIQRLYRNLLGREADWGGLTNWYFFLMSRGNTVQARAELVSMFILSAEYQHRLRQGII